MSGAWPWLAVAAAGALHGLNPASGWLGVAAWRLRGGGEPLAAWRALAPVAAGQAACVALVAVLAALGALGQRGLLPWVAGGLAFFVAAIHVSGRLPCALRGRAAGTGLALASLAMAGVQGAGMMLVPALVPLCVSASPARQITASGSMALALAAVALHLAAMLAVTAGLAALAVRGLVAVRTRASGGRQLVAGRRP